MKRIIIFFLLCASVLHASNNFEKYTIGYSIKKRPIELYKFGDGHQVLLIAAGIHGNEENTSKTAGMLITLLDEKKIRINKDKSVWIIPELNPDGLARSRRLNDNDVDLNRNFATSNWKPRIVFFNNIFSAGDEPFSEPETMCIKDLIERTKNENVMVVLSLHSSGNAIIPGDDSRMNKQLLALLYENSDYIFTDIGYNTTGDLTAWLSSKNKIASLTIEFKTKTETETDEMEKIIAALIKTDFEKKIYNTDINIMDMFKNNDAKILYSLASDLPENISDNVKAANPRIFLEKINECKAQDELLFLVNKTNLLAPDYEPEDLVKLTPKDIPSNKAQFYLRKILMDDLKAMISDAKNDGAGLSVISAYRSYATQKDVYEGWKNRLGEKEASRVSALPGASQHQLGTAIDFNSLNESFELSKEGKWLLNNAYKYGFVISYPKDQESITGYKYEPWHYRYVGKDAAFLIFNYFDNSLEIFLNWFWQKNDEK